MAYTRIEVKDTNKEQRIRLMTFGPVDRLNEHFVNVEVPDRMVDNIADYLDSEKLDWRLV